MAADTIAGSSTRSAVTADRSIATLQWWLVNRLADGPAGGNFELNVEDEGC